MPKLKKSGDVFRLGADGAFDGIWFTSGTLRANAGISYEGGVEFCHGLDAAVAVEASAEIAGALTVFLPSVRAEGHAFAGVGAGVQAQLAPNVFDKVGLSIDAKALAQASVAGRISLGLDFTEIARLAEDQLSDLAYDLFIAFLNEIVVQAGVWGKASFSAAAEAHLEVNGTVLGDDPGFQIAAGAGVGWGGGTGWDFFAKAEIEDPRRLYTTVSELLIAELSHQARQEMPPEYAPAIEVFEFVAPIAAITAYDLGEMASEEVLRPANQSVAPFLRAFSQRVALYTLDKLVELGTELLSSALMDALSHVLRRPIPDADRQALTGHVGDAIDILGDGPLELDSVVEALTPLMDILSILAPDLADRWQEELALLWSAAVTARALRRSAAKAQVTLNVLGLGAAVSGEVLGIPPPPDAVRQAYARHFGAGMPAIGFDNVVDYLTDRSLGPLLQRHVPMVSATLGTLAETLGITVGDLVEAALTGAIGEDLSETDLYVQLRDHCKAQMEDVVLTELIPPMRDALAGTPDAVAYIDDVVVPVLKGASNFAFDRVDTLVAGLSAADFDPFNQSFKEGLADLVWLMFARNVVFFTDVMLDTAIEHLHDGLTDLEMQARGDEAEAMVAGALTLGSEAFPGFVPADPDHVEALRDLIADLLGAGATAFGPSIWTQARRAHLKALLQRLLDRGTAGDYGDLPAVEAALVQIAECYYVKDAEGVVLVLRALAELTAEEFEVVVERVIPALEIFFLRLSAKRLDQVEAQVVAFIGLAADLLRGIEDLLAEIGAALVTLAQDIAELGGQAAAALSAVATELSSQGWRDDVLNALENRAMDVAEAAVRAAPGFDLQPADWKAQQIATARGTASFAFGGVRPLIDTALQLSGTAIATAAQGVDAASSTPLAILALTGALRQAMLDQVAAAGITLPPDLSVTDLENAVTDALNTTAFQSLVEAYVDARRAELDAIAERDRQEDEQARLMAEAAEARAAQGALVGTAPAIEIVSPAPVDPRHGFVYPRKVPVHVIVTGARESFLDPGAPRRTMVRLNGAEVMLSDAAWRFDVATQTLVLSGHIGAGLRPGLNTLEVSLADAVSVPVRATVSFLCNPALEPRGAGLCVAGELSQFDTPGNDHKAAAQEYVALRNDGDAMLNLGGLHVSDRAGHLYTFASRRLAPGAVIRLRSGKGRDSATDVHWGRSAAVWNNRGDTVYVHDADRVLWCEYSYEGGRP